MIDAHVHVWDTTVFDYPWLSAAAELPRRALPADIDRANGQTTRMIFVEADRAPAQGLAEAQWADAAAWPDLAGIVAYADLAALPASAALDELAAVDHVVGIRYPLQNTAAGAWNVPALIDGLHELARRSLTFDACVRGVQLPALADLLERAPEAHAVLDHLGKPPVAAGADSTDGRAWRDGLRRIAALPHTAVKLSGLAAETTDAGAYDRNVDAFLAAAVDAFGPERCMIGSDWPVSACLGVSTTTADWIERVRRATAATGEEWMLLTEGAAAAFYRV